MTTLRLFLLATIFIIGNVIGAAAQAPTTMPPGMTQAQFDAMVDAISKAVAAKLKADEGRAEPAPATSSPPDAAGNLVTGPVTAFFERAERVFHGAPVLGSNLAAMRRHFDESDRGGRGIPQFLLLLAVVAVLSLAVEPILRKALGGLRRRVAGGAAAERGLASLVNLGLLAVLDGVAVLAFWIVASIALATLFAGPTEQDRFAATALVGFSCGAWPSWASASCCSPICRPPLVPIPDREARLMYLWLSVILFAINFGAVLNGVLGTVGAATDTVATGRIVMAPVAVGLFLWFVVQSADAVRYWCNGLVGAPRLYRLIGDHWIAVAVPFFLLMGMALIYGAVSELTDVASALRLTIGLIIGLLIFETLLSALLQRVRSTPGPTPAGERARLSDVLARCLRVAVLIGIAVVLANAWAVNVLGLVDASQWNTLSVQLRTAGATLFAGFVVWELLKFTTDPYVVPKGGLVGSNASRLSTLLPLLRATLGIVIALVAVLIVLADLGVNITPLLAGASILGLAVSFGQPGPREGHRVGHLLPDRRCLPRRRIHRMRPDPGSRRRLHPALDQAAPSDRPASHDPVRRSRQDRELQPRLGDREVRFQLSARHRHRAGAPCRRRRRRRAEERPGLWPQDPGAAQGAGRRVGHRQCAGHPSSGSPPSPAIRKPSSATSCIA